jgi:hypothetical protein
MAGTPLVIGEAQRRDLAALRERAAADPSDMLVVAEQIKTPAGKRMHMDRMNALTIDIPLGYTVTFSIETGHGAGTCRHMSMASGRRDRVPTQEAVWMVAELLGFTGGLESCTLWLEELQRGPDPVKDRAKAVNVVQPLATVAAASA